MWVRLNNNQNIVRKGVMTHYKKGDWVSVGRQTAQQWIDGGCAVGIDPEELAKGVQTTSGILVRGGIDKSWRKQLESIGEMQLAFADEDWEPILPFTETLIWKTSLELRLDLLFTGFMLLKTWQVVVPLFDYTTLALHIGKQSERDATEAVIRDLRVPVRDTRLIYARRCDATRQLMTVWGEAMKTCPNEQLSFMQALYTVKPIVCDVPASWGGKGQ